jgi:hypothetical protein
MPKFVGFNAGQMVIVDRVYRKSRYVLEKAVNDIGLTRYRTYFDDLMGSSDSSSDNKNADAILGATIRKMFMCVATFNYQVQYCPDNFRAYATMQCPPGHTFEDVQDRLDEWNRTRSIQAPLLMRLNPAFFILEEVSLFEQSQVQVFLHELSHHAAATIDDLNAVDTKRLRGLGPMRAVRNADSVACFLTRYAF